MIRTPTGVLAEADALALFERVGFTPPPGTSTQDAFLMLLELAQQQEEEAERLWLKAIEMIYQIKQEVSDELQDLDQKDLNNFHIFLLTRIQAFMMRMAEYVSLEKIINFLQRIGK